MSDNKTNGGIGSVANWSWLWVTSPLWLPISIIIGLTLLITIIKVIKGQV